MSDFIDNTKGCATCEIEGCEIGATINTAQFANLSFSTSGDCNIATLTNGGFNVTTINLLLNSNPNSLIEITSSLGTIYLFAGALTNVNPQNYEYDFNQVPLGFQNCTVTCSELLGYAGGTVGIIANFNEVAINTIPIEVDVCEVTDNLQTQIDNLSGGPSLNTVTEVIYQEQYFARSSNGTTQDAGNRNATIVRTAVGRWTVTFATPHPDGTNYHPSLSNEEQSTNRDAIDPQVVQGSQTANGFQVMLTTGDNGTGADLYTDTPWSFGVNAPITVLTNVTLI